MNEEGPGEKEKNLDRDVKGYGSEVNVELYEKMGKA